MSAQELDGDQPSSLPKRWVVGSRLGNGKEEEKTLGSSSFSFRMVRHCQTTGTEKEQHLAQSHVHTADKAIAIGDHGSVQIIVAHKPTLLLLL